VNAPARVSPQAESRVLSNGRYRVLVTAVGSGASMFGPALLTRYVPDPTCEGQGWFLYIRDLDSGRMWSAGHQPVQQAPIRYAAHLGEGVVKIEREDGAVETCTEIWVDPVEDMEWRRLTLTNRGGEAQRLELTTYAEVALDSPDADAAHPAFSKLFVQTEFLPDLGALMAWRRVRGPEEAPLFLGHLLIVPTSPAGRPEYETDRARFIGRGRSLADPLALRGRAALSGTVGGVLDPILSLRRSLVLEAGASIRLYAVLIAARERGDAERLLAAAMDLGSRQGAAPPPHARAPASPRFLLPRALVARAPCSPAPGCDAPASDQEQLRFFNGHGGFNQAGDEYVIRIDRSREGCRLPPQPWANVVANPTFGFVASERGLGFTWHGNSRESRLTPWFNDPVRDPQGEALYLRDEDARLYWSPTPGPVPGAGPYEVRHGFGYTIWRHPSQGLVQEVCCFVPRNDAVKVVRLRVTNTGAAARRLSAFFYAEWVLGRVRSETVTEIQTVGAEDEGLMLASRGNPEAGGPVAFAAGIGPSGARLHMSGDRAAFLGRWGSVERPQALAMAAALDGRTGTGLDPCAALQVSATLPPGATGEWVFLLGRADNPAAAMELAERYRDGQVVEAALEEVRRFWRGLFAIQVETPSAALDLLVNGWLVYQNLSCRLWARSAFYQSGGAFGFRDQLQDATALVWVAPEYTRQQILLHAAHQFVEGDVLHWWHPPTGYGLRTRVSDDLLWLPYAVLVYLESTGDDAVLDQRARFLAAPPLEAGQREALVMPVDSGSEGSLYDHCCRALDRSLTRGPHGLPLMGTGDWNDGMNRVGADGRGESVWLGFFLHLVLERFVPVCLRRGDWERVRRYRSYLSGLARALDAAGWDGNWYRRAYYDDGTPLGAATAAECRIDALAQAWAILSGVAPPDRAMAALEAVERDLVDQTAGVIRLLAPPFDSGPQDPGYIKAYIPGIRENGGQYTHAALWVVQAEAEAGRAEQAARLFEMLNPIRHGGTPAGIATYRVEPYVVAADVYGLPPHTGRGGWTWYTGSAGWMYRIALESILGMALKRGRTLVLRPRLPPQWPGFTLRYRLPDARTEYVIVVRRRGPRTAVRAPKEATLVDEEAGEILVDLRADGGTHRVEVDLGSDLRVGYRPRSGHA